MLEFPCDLALIHAIMHLSARLTNILGTHSCYDFPINRWFYRILYYNISILYIHYVIKKSCAFSALSSSSGIRFKASESSGHCLVGSGCLGWRGSLATSIGWPVGWPVEVWQEIFHYEISGKKWLINSYWSWSQQNPNIVLDLDPICYNLLICWMDCQIVMVYSTGTS